MELFKKILKVLGYALFIFFVSVAVSLGGGVPIPRSTRKEDLIEMKIEMAEPKEPDSNTLKLEFKQ
ncbi:MAG: hypothetical protein ABIS12_07550 [Bacteroidia bacterium]